MNRAVVILFALATLVASGPGFAGEEPAESPPSPLYPPIEPYETGMLRVSERHEIYWEQSGNPAGIPLILLHGGPGVELSPALRRMVDPERYRIIGFDQRGCGKSRPWREWRDNDTRRLVEDIETLRAHLGIDAPAVFWGLSWGTTLALAYASAHPDRVAGMILIGVFTCRDEEIDFLYHGGAAAFYPENYERFRALVPHPERGNYPMQLFEIISGADSVRAKEVGDSTAFYEMRMTAVERTDAQAWAAVEKNDLSAFALLSTWYVGNRCFLDGEALLRDASRLGAVPVYIANGNQDAVTPPKTAFELARRLSNARLDIVPGASHNDMAVFASAVEGSAWVADQVVAAGAGGR